jgi:bifunctional non-homologous end joining protein LigD
MPLATGFVPPCIPTLAYKVPSGPDWIHEVKHDGYRLQVRREGDSVRLYTRRGFDWTSRYPAIVRTALELPAKSCTLDGEAVVCGGDGIAVVADLHRRGVVTEAMLYAFDLLEYGGEDLRPFPLSDRKRLLAKPASGASESCCRSIPTRTYSKGFAGWGSRVSSRSG